MDVKLIAVGGPGQGQAVDVRGKLFIGADPHCRIRPPVSGLSGVHALVEVRDGHVFVRDCDTKSGTILNDRTFHSKEHLAFDGDLVAVGGYAFEVRIRPRDDHDVETFDEVPEGWPAVPAVRERPRAEAETISAVFEPFERRTSPEGTFTYEAPGTGEAMIVALNAKDLNDENTISPLRSDLESLSTMGLPVKVVVDLGNVAYMSSRAVGVVLAHYQRLDRDGGTMRVCRANGNVVPVLHQMRLDRLIDVYDTLEEATAAPWE